MREAEPVTPPQPGAPVRQTAVRPPTTGAVRGLNAQGGLGEVRPADGEPRPVVPQGHFTKARPAAPRVEPQPGGAGRPDGTPHAASPHAAPTQAMRQPGTAPAGPVTGGPAATVPTVSSGTLGSGPTAGAPDATPSTAARPLAGPPHTDRVPVSPVAPGVPVPPIARAGGAVPAAMPAQVAPFVPARPDDPSAPVAPVPGTTWGAGTFTAPQPGQPPFGHQPQPGAPQPGAPLPAQRSQAPSPESGWTPAVSGAVRAPVEPGTLPPGVLAPVSEPPPAGTFVPTGSMPIVMPGSFGSPVPVGAGMPGAGSAPGTVADPARGTSDDAGATPAWGSLGISADDLDEPDLRPQRGYTWLHMVVLSIGAFVAGLLVWLLLIQGRGTGGPEGLAESPAGSVGAVSAVVHPHAPGEL